MKINVSSKQFTTIFLSAFFATLSVNATTTKLGYINFDGAFALEHEAQKLSKELEGEEQIILEGEQKARTEIEAKMAKFRDTMGKLSEKARQDQETALGNEINLLQQQFTQRRLELNQKRQKISADLESKNRLIVESIGKQENFAAIFSSAALVFVSDEIKKNDITNKVAERYNKAYPVKADASKKPTPPKKASGKK